MDLKNQYRITKYDPSYRVNGVYTRDEWTSICDVGKVYENVKFKIEDYLKVENSYLNVVKEVLLELNINTLQIECLKLQPIQIECTFPSSFYHRFSNHDILYSIEDILCIVEGCLREICWCKLIGDNFFIHFGYDYYVYIGCDIEENHMKEIASRNCLFAELIEESPYLICDADVEDKAGKYICDPDKVDYIWIVRLDEYVDAEYRYKYTILSEVTDTFAFVEQLNNIEQMENWGDPIKPSIGCVAVLINYIKGDYELLYHNAQWFNISGENQYGCFSFNEKQFNDLITQQAPFKYRPQKDN